MNRNENDNDNELNNLIWYFSLTKKEKDLLNNLPNNIKGGLDWMSLRAGKFAEVSVPVAAKAPSREKVNPFTKKASKMTAKVAMPGAANKADLAIPKKKGRGRPKKV